MPFSFETLGCDMHLLLDVIKKNFVIQNDYENNPPIVEETLEMK
jgi:hypothetical protein